MESVAWVSERKDVLSGLFFALTIGAYVRYARRPWASARYGLVVLLFALGLMCKPMLVTLPLSLIHIFGYALLQKGNVAEAIIHFQKALELARAAGRQDIVERLNAELKQLQGGTSIPSGK